MAVHKQLAALLLLASCAAGVKSLMMIYAAAKRVPVRRRLPALSTRGRSESQRPLAALQWGSELQIGWETGSAASHVGARAAAGY